MGKKFHFGGRKKPWLSMVRFFRENVKIILPVLLVGAIALSWRSELIGGVVRATSPLEVHVIDANHLFVRGTEYRLYGTDAPEEEQSCQDRFGRTWYCGRAAMRALVRKIGKSTDKITCSTQGKDRGERKLGICRQGKVDLNDWLVREGHAMAYRQFSNAYVDAENEARTAVKGLWAGQFVRPADWRLGKRL